MASSSLPGWKGLTSKLQAPVGSNSSKGKVEIAESSPFVVQSGLSPFDDDGDDELENDGRLFLEASHAIEEEEECFDHNKVLYQVQAIGDFKGQEDGDLTFKTGEILQILESSTSHDDGWLMAENALGETGIIPSNHVQKLQDISETRLQKVSDETSTVKREGKHLWSKLRSNVKQTSLSDVLNAFGALPSGFRESTLKELLNESNDNCMSSSIFPRLTMTGMAFKDLKWDYAKDQLQSRASTVSRDFVILAAKMIPITGKDLKVLSRHVRIALFNKNEVLSNIHTVRATWNQQEEKTWTFIPKNLTANNSLYHRTGTVRINTMDRSTELLFELCIIFKKKSGQVKEFSSGWSTLPLFDHTGAQMSNRTYELKVHGGTPFESGIELDAAQGIRATGDRVPSILKRNRTPRLYIQLVSQGREAKTNSNFLPSKIVTSQHYVKAIGCYRQLVGEAFLSNRKGLPVPSLVCRPALDLFIKAIDQPDVMDYTMGLWQQYLKISKRNERNNFVSVSNILEKVLLEHTYPVLHSTTLLPLIWGNLEREKEREMILEKLSKYQMNSGLLFNDLRMTPFNVGEQIFKVYAR